MQTALIEVENVSVVRDGARILDSLTLRVEQGEQIVILGPNGCGKSTFLRLLTREIHPYAGIGKVEVLGQRQWTQVQLRKMIGVVGVEPIEPLLGTPTVSDMVLSGLFGSYGVLLYDEVTTNHKALAIQAMEKLEISHLADRAVETLSLGERRRTWIARALVSEPKALVLDEPTTGLDIGARCQLLATLKRLRAQGTATVLVTHHFEEIPEEVCRIILMANGRLVADGPADDILTPRLLEQVFGLPLEASILEGGWHVRQKNARPAMP